MKKNLNIFGVIVISCILAVSCSKDDTSSSSNNMIIDHNCIDLSKIPDDAINKASSDLYIAFNSSWWRGTEITYGLYDLAGFKGALYRINEFGVDGQLRFDANHAFGNVNNIENSRDSSWYKVTRDTLKANKKINVVMWSWEEGVSEAKSSEIDIYLNLMNQLEQDFPNVKFVYMTGALDGTSNTDNLYLRNEQIRKYCKDNNKILFDFADIESYDPDGVYYGDKLANDTCGYDSNNDGKVDKNWATEWQKTHSKRWYECGPDQTPPLNSNQKAYAAWWMFARIAGWDGTK
jgi:hypothetical protein